jgi:hypothetical protein
MRLDDVASNICEADLKDVGEGDGTVVVGLGCVRAVGGALRAGGGRGARYV